MPAMRRALGVVVALLAVPGTASAAGQQQIWSSYPSGVTAGDITGVDLRAADDVWYVTDPDDFDAGGGQVFRNGNVNTNAPGVRFTDIALNPSGTVGLAVGRGGELWRSTGAGPFSDQGAIATRASCGGAVVPAGDLHAIVWQDDSVVYVVGQDGTVLRSQNAGQAWAEVNKSVPGCVTNVGASDFTDVALSGTTLTLVTEDGKVARAQTPFASGSVVTDAAACAGAAVVATDGAKTIVARACEGGSPESLRTSADGSETFARPTRRSPDTTSDNGLHDAAWGGGVGIAVGNANRVFLLPDTGNAYVSNPGTGLIGVDWNAADKVGKDLAAIGGDNGKLAVTAQASRLPDLVGPSGTISGPDTVTVGQTATFTADVADDGSPHALGIDPDGFEWTGSGFAMAKGSPAQVLATLTGVRTLKVTFRDKAGNIGEATKQVTVLEAPSTPTQPGPGPGAQVPPAAAKKGVKVTTLQGATLTLTGPSKCVKPKGTFTAKLTAKKASGTSRFVSVARVGFSITNGKTKTDTKAPFTKTLKLGTKSTTLRAKVRLRLKQGKVATVTVTLPVKRC